MKTLLLVLAGLAVMAAIAFAQDYVVLDRTAENYDRVQIQPDGTLRVVDAISRETGVPTATIEAQRAQYGLGYGGLLIANSLAAETGRRDADDHDRDVVHAHDAADHHSRAREAALPVVIRE